MELKIRPSKGSEKDVKMLRDATHFIVHRLLKPEQVRRLNLNIVFTKMRDDAGRVDIEAAPSFLIRLHPDNDGLFQLITLAHELVHVAQVMNGRLKIRKIKGLYIWVWEDVRFGTDPYADSDLVLPWESEAEQQECDLALSFFAAYCAKLNSG